MEFIFQGDVHGCLDLIKGKLRKRRVEIEINRLISDIEFAFCDSRFSSPICARLQRT